MYNENFRGDYGFRPDDIDINITNQNLNTNTNTNTNMNMASDVDYMQGGNVMMGQPIVEAGRERCVYRNIYHEVPHVCPINTKVINNHIFRHTYSPRYTCSEENIVTNQQCGSCCNFR